MLKILGRVFDIVVEALSSLFLFAMFIVVIYGVYSRHMIARPVFWTDELARYCMFYMVMIGAAASLTADIHPALTFVTQGFKGAAKFVLDMWVELLIILTLVLLFTGGWEMVAGARRGKTAALRLYYSWVYFGVPLGCFLMSISAFRRLCRIIGGRNDKAEL